MEVDLHIHTTASDGTSTPQEVVEIAAHYGLRAIAITDHDEVGGITPALLAGRLTGIEVIPGIEINTEYEQREVHILGYLIDYHDPKLLAQLKRLQDARLIRISKIVNALRQLGLPIELSRVRELAGNGSIGRPHIGMAMIEQGYVKSIQEAFHRFIGFGCPAYVPRYKIGPEEVVEMILGAKGVPILAHPGLVNRDDLIPKLVKVGLQGLEVYYPEHEPWMVGKYLKLTDKYGLIATGGSDYHGNGANYRADIGTVTVSYRVVDQLKECQRLYKV